MPEHGSIFQYFKLTTEQGKFIEENIGLLYDYLHKAISNNKIGYEEKDELEGILNIKLCQATRTYDTNKGYKFSTYLYKAFDTGLVSYYKEKTYFKHKVISWPVNKDGQLMDVEYTSLSECDWNKMETLFKKAEIKNRSKIILKLRYRECFSESEVGDIMNLSRQRIGQICKNSIKELAIVVEEEEYQMEDFVCLKSL